MAAAQADPLNSCNRNETGSKMDSFPPFTGISDTVESKAEAKEERVTSSPLKPPRAKRKLFTSPFTCAPLCTAHYVSGGHHVAGCRLAFSSSVEVVFERPGPPSSCVVWFAKEYEGDKKYVVKMCDRRRLLNETRIFDHLASQGAPIQSFGRCEAVWMDEYLDRGYMALYMHERSIDLLDFFNVQRHLPTSIERRLFLSHQLTSLVRQLHAMGIAHLDLKPENVLITLKNEKEWHLSLIDYDASILYSSRGTEAYGPYKRKFGTPGYKAPEVNSDVPFFPHAADKWSLGVILYTLLTGRPLFPDPTDEKHVKEVQQVLLSKQLPFGKKVPPAFADTLSSLMASVESRGIGLDVVEEQLSKLLNESLRAGDSGTTVDKKPM